MKNNQELKEQLGKRMAEDLRSSKAREREGGPSTEDGGLARRLEGEIKQIRDLYDKLQEGLQSRISLNL